MGEVSENDIGRVEEFLETLKKGEIEGFIIIAPRKHGDEFEFYFGGCWVSVEMLGRLDYMQYKILQQYVDGKEDVE